MIDSKSISLTSPSISSHTTSPAGGKKASTTPAMGPQQDRSTLKAHGNGTASPAAGRKDDSKVVQYKECQRNHAAGIGAYAVDGCREFMALGAEGTEAALICAACECHRSFHKRVVVEAPDCDRSSVDTS